MQMMLAELQSWGLQSWFSIETSPYHFVAIPQLPHVLWDILLQVRALSASGFSFPCPQEHLHGVCRIAHQTGLKEARKFWEEGQRADRQPHHISLVSSAKQAKNNNSRITDV